MRWELLPSRLDAGADGRALVMLRVAAALVAIAQIALVVPALIAQHGKISTADFFYAFNFFIGLLFVQLTFRAWMLAVWRQITLAGCICLLASVGSLALLNGNTEFYFISGFMIVLGAGALLPWETRWQDSLSIATIFGMFAVAWFSQHGALSIFHWIGISTAAAVAHFAASLGEQNRVQLTRQNLRLADNEAALRKAMDSILDPLCIIDLRTRRYINVNEEFLVATGFTREEVIGKRWNDLNIWFDDVTAELLTSRVISDLKVRNEEVMVRNSDGMPAPALVSAVVLELGNRECALFIARDISRLKETQRQLEAASRAALAASKAKSEFLSSMSHEIRTPMNAILGTADLLSETSLNSVQSRYVGTLVSNGNALLELINSVLDLARMESGRLNLEATTFDLVELIEKTVETLAVRADEKQLELTLRFAPDIPTQLVGDPLRLRQVITNLVGNAIKFTDEGDVAIQVARDPASENPAHLSIAVSDTGIGIGADKLNKVFSAFTQADSSTTRKYGGSGLGLAIVERLVGLMGGQVWAESIPGRGSTFSFTAHFELGGMESNPNSFSSKADLAGTRILIIDDNPTNCSMLAEMLTHSGARVTQSASAADGLRLLHAANDFESPFTLMFIDQRMPEMDGLELLERLHSQSWRIPPAILMVTSTTFSADRVRMEQLGVSHFVFKPLRRRDVYATISQIVGDREHETFVNSLLFPAGIRPVSEESRTLRILLADDSPDNRLIVKAFLQKTSFRIDEVENGERVVERIRQGTYDLVLMDIQMPVLDGFAATRAIREWEIDQGLAPIPIIALTASALDEDVQRARDAGCNLHVSKPIKKKTLLNAIASLTNKLGSADTASTISL